MRGTSIGRNVKRLNLATAFRHLEDSCPKLEQPDADLLSQAFYTVDNGPIGRAVKQQDYLNTWRRQNYKRKTAPDQRKQSYEDAESHSTVPSDGGQPDPATLAKKTCEQLYDTSDESVDLERATRRRKGGRQAGQMSASVQEAPEHPATTKAKAKGKERERPRGSSTSIYRCEESSSSDSSLPDIGPSSRPAKKARLTCRRSSSLVPQSNQPARRSDSGYLSSGDDRPLRQHDLQPRYPHAKPGKPLTRSSQTARKSTRTSSVREEQGAAADGDIQPPPARAVPRQTSGTRDAVSERDRIGAQIQEVEQSGVYLDEREAAALADRLDNADRQQSDPSRKRPKRESRSLSQSADQGASLMAADVTVKPQASSRRKVIMIDSASPEPARPATISRPSPEVEIILRRPAPTPAQRRSTLQPTQVVERSHTPALAAPTVQRLPSSARESPQPINVPAGGAPAIVIEAEPEQAVQPVKREAAPPELAMAPMEISDSEDLELEETDPRLFLSDASYTSDEADDLGTAKWSDISDTESLQNWLDVRDREIEERLADARPLQQHLPPLLLPFSSLLSKVDITTDAEVRESIRPHRIDFWVRKLAERYPDDLKSERKRLELCDRLDELLNQ